MDKLQWFKFTPSDWMMGKIQRCDETTQARFIRLCCLYWNKECCLSLEDAEIEIDKDCLDVLLSKKIVTTENDSINISFLDEQLFEIEDTTNNRSKSGKVGNLKRWHPEIYKRYEKKEISLNEATRLSRLSHPDRTPITPQSQNIAEKRREEERREENILKDEDLKNELYVKPHLRDGFNPVSNDNQFNKHTFVAWFNTSLDYIGFNGALKSLSKEDNNKLNILLDKGYTIQDFKIAFKNFQGSTFYKKEGHITTTQFLKGDTFDRFLIMGDSKVKQTKGGDVTQW